MESEVTMGPRSVEEMTSGELVKMFDEQKGEEGAAAAVAELAKRMNQEPDKIAELLASGSLPEQSEDTELAA